MSYLAPVAFVFVLEALAQVGKLKTEVEELKKEVASLKSNKD
jgi:cell division protein FtsB